MARWAAGARERLEQAALDLFQQQGFQETTVPQITARAGLTTRTFFRYFADKREVLFARDADVAALIGQLMQQTPPGVTPMTLITHQLAPFAQTVFGEQREALRLRQRIVETDLSLGERELRKMSTIRAALVTGFVQRGTELLTAQIAADLSISVLGTALEHWLTAEGNAPLAEYVGEALRALETLIGPTI